MLYLPVHLGRTQPPTSAVDPLACSARRIPGVAAAPAPTDIFTCQPPQQSRKRPVPVSTGGRQVTATWLPKTRALRQVPTVAAVTALGLVLASGMAGASATVPSSATALGAVADPASPIDCPAAQPLSGVRAGQHGTGFTVTRGTQPQPFDVEILGVMPDAVAPGRDLILVKVADKPGVPVISQGGGIWAGMSGSPVYIGNKLLGSVSYAVSFSTTTIGGVTPAEDLFKVLARPTSARAARGTQPVAPAPRVSIPTSLRRQLAARTGSAVPSTMQQVPVSMGVS